LKTWRIIFVNPKYGVLTEMKGGDEGGRIVLRGVDDEGTSLRWTFNDITANSFVWRGEKSRDGGKTWKLEEEHHMNRRLASQRGSSSDPANDPRLDMIRVLRAQVRVRAWVLKRSCSIAFSAHGIWTALSTILKATRAVWLANGDLVGRSMESSSRT
jgi:hypothetical protein